ncbi:MAG TPA: cytochrome P460 family protein [Urbifossiella sp.]|nr:cytochrome P460 family protein [Urbifossiella sp.]
MRAILTAVTAIGLSGCGQRTPAPEPALPEPAAFAAWPRVTDRPVPVHAAFWAWCREPTPDEKAALEKHGPHGGGFIVVRVSPEAIEAFRDGRPLPVGAIVIKEKYADEAAAGPLLGYTVMLKREVGYAPDGGDWEYADISLAAEGRESRGRLATCAGCHASERDRDYLFRTYAPVGR